jgi:hypothetical protein
MGVLPALMSRYHLSLDQIADLPKAVLEDLLADLADRQGR